MRGSFNSCMNSAASPAAPLHDTAALYRRHWPALCAFARAKGCETHDAEDAVQELFARLVAQGQHERAAAISDPDEQSAFLLARLRTHLIKRWRHRTRLRRGGGAVCFSLSDENGENIDIADSHASPDAEMDRAWARKVIDEALTRVSVELHTQGRMEVWGCLERSVSEGGRGERPCDGRMRVALHRARQRLRVLIRARFKNGEEELVFHAALA
jgi:DNA-directed RNA polymerase specialized sigma24 family protein